MEREDLRSKIMPITIENIDNFQNIGNEEFNTTDLIYIDSYKDQYNERKTNEERRVTATDYAVMNNAYIYDMYKTHTGKEVTFSWLRSSYDSYNAYYISGNGECNYIQLKNRDIGICPSLHYKIPDSMIKQNLLRDMNSEQNKEKVEKIKLDIRHVKNVSGEIIYHTIQIGEYPKTKVDKNLNKILEALYHGGKIKEGLSCTGRWYSCNGRKQDHKEYIGKHSPEFEYDGNKYVRVIVYQDNQEVCNSEEIVVGEARWVKVEPISFEIKNWDEMPKCINPNGNGRAKYFDLRAEDVIIANIPFYPNELDENSQFWQNSSIRGFLNGIDVRNIAQNGATEYTAKKGGNFTGECNFLNEAFNLSRQPIIEYIIPDSETEIADDAFNGCVSLKKVVIHTGIKYIGERAFEGLEFKYAYRTKTEELVLAQELPKNAEEYKEVIEFSKIIKSFEGFDYSSILLRKDKLEKIIEFSEILNRNKFKIPYIYGLVLVEKGMTELFWKDSDFRFFKGEFPKINDTLLDFPEEERLDFFKFAKCLGCFSTEKMLDEQGKKMQIIFAQKACSVLTQLLKTDKMKLRKIS